MAWRLTLILLAVLAGACIPAAGAIDPIQVTSNTTFSGPADFWGNSLVEADDGSFVVAGGILSENGSLPDAFVWRSAQDWWYDTYGGEMSEDIAADIIEVDDGYVFAGYSDATQDGTYDAWVAKIDRTGRVLWTWLYGAAGDEAARSIVNAPDGGYTFAGATLDPETDLEDVWVVHLDADGIALWNRTFGGEGDDSAYDIVRSFDGYLVTGSQDSFTEGDSDAWMISLDPDGNPLWGRSFGVAGQDEIGISGLQTAEYILLAGSTNPHGGNEADADFDAYVVRLGLDGRELWNRTFGGSDWDVATSIQPAPDGAVVAGATYVNRTQGNDAWIAKLSNDGSVAWSQTFGGPYDDEARSLIRTEGGLAFTGILDYASPAGAAKSAAWIVGFEELPAALPTSVPTPVGTGGGSAAIYLTARGFAFDQDVFAVPAGSMVTIYFTNEDSGVPHNVAVYTDDSAMDAIFRGAVVTGPAAAIYSFTAPDQPGIYFFRCDVHPRTMTGTVLVTEA